MEVDDADLPVVESHANALARGERCGCPDGEAIADWLRRLAERHVPAGLIESIDLGRGWRDGRPADTRADRGGDGGPGPGASVGDRDAPFER